MGTKKFINKTTLLKIRHYAAQLKSAGIPVDKLILFGSHAKGTAHTWSDVDVCVVSPDFGKDRHSERVMLMNLQDTQSVDIEPHPYSSQDLADKYDSLAKEIRTYGIAVS